MREVLTFVGDGFSAENWRKVESALDRIEAVVEAARENFSHREVSGCECLRFPLYEALSALDSSEVTHG